MSEVPAPGAPPAPPPLTRSPRRSVARRILLAVVATALSLLLALTILEVYLRLTLEFPPALETYVIDFEVGKVLRPNHKGDHYGALASINKWGMRERDCEKARPQGAKRVIALGDSWTFGVCVPVEDTWPKQLENRLGGPAKVEVLNTGVSGYETYNEQVVYHRDWRTFEHDLVLIGYYPVNDVHDKRRAYARHKALHDIHPWLYELYVFPKKHLVASYWLDGLRKKLKAKKREAHYERAADDDDGRDFESPDDDWTELYKDDYSGWPLVKESLVKIGEDARGAGAKAALVLFPDVQDLTRYEKVCHPKIAPLLADACKKAGIELIDTKDDFLPWKGKELEVALGGKAGSTHVNAKGYTVISGTIAREVEARGLLGK